MMQIFTQKVMCVTIHYNWPLFNDEHNSKKNELLSQSFYA